MVWAIVSASLLLRLLFLRIRDRQLLRELQPVDPEIQDEYFKLASELQAPGQRKVSLQWSTLIACMVATLALLFGGIGIVSLRADAPQAGSPSEQAESQANLSANQENTDDSLTVLAPDGSRARNVKMALASSRNCSVVLSGDSEPISAGNTLLKPTTLADDAQIDLASLKGSQFIILWNELGFLQLSTNRLPETKSLKLQPWGSLDLTILEGDQPLARYPVSISKWNTSEGMHAGAHVFIAGFTDKDGKLYLPQVPPGALSIDRNNRRFQYRSVSSTICERSTSLILQPGEHVEFSQGGKGRTVTGELQFAAAYEGMPGELTVDQRKEVFSFILGPDGRFSIPDVPSGQCELTFRPIGSPSKSYYRQRFECLDNPNELSLDLGVIEAKDHRQTRVEASQHAINSLTAGSIPTKESVTLSSEPIAVITTISDGPTGSGSRPLAHYAFLDKQGKLIFELKDVSTPAMWASNSAQAALDKLNHRIAFLIDHDNVQPALCVMSDHGKPLWTRWLDPAKNYRVAIDEQSGHIWLAVIESISDSRIEVLDVEGNRLKEYDLNAFTLSYSRTDQSFWLGGQRLITKVDRDGQTIAKYELPDGIFVVHYLQPLADGGVLACESAHADLPGSANRVWRLDSKCSLLGAVDLGATYLHEMAPQPFGNDFIVAGDYRQGYLGAAKSRQQVLRISGDLKTLRIIDDLNSETISNPAQVGEVWLNWAGQLHHVSWDSQGKITAKASIKQKSLSVIR